MVACRPLFTAHDPHGAREQLLSAPIPRVSRDRFVRGEPISARLSAVIARALQREPSARFATFAEMADALQGCGEIAERSDVGIFLDRILDDGLDAAPVSEVDSIIRGLLDDADPRAPTTVRPGEAVQPELLGESPTLRPEARSPESAREQRSESDSELETVIELEPLVATHDACDESSVQPSHDLAALDVPLHRKRRLVLVAGIAASLALLLLWSLGGHTHTTPPRALATRVLPANVAAAQPASSPASSSENAPAERTLEPEPIEAAPPAQIGASGAAPLPATRVAPAVQKVSARPRRGLKKSSPANEVFVPDDI